MQVVGRSCELCEKRIASELDGVGCPTCSRFFHDACLTAPEPEKEKPETYRAPVASAKKKKKRKRDPLCPGCGADLRADQNARSRGAYLWQEEYEQNRREHQSQRAVRAIWTRVLLRLALVAIVGLVLLVYSMRGMLP